MTKIMPTHDLDIIKCKSWTILIVTCAISWNAVIYFYLFIYLSKSFIQINIDICRHICSVSGSHSPASTTSTSLHRPQLELRVKSTSLFANKILRVLVVMWAPVPAASELLVLAELCSSPAVPWAEFVQSEEKCLILIYWAWQGREPGTRQAGLEGDRETGCQQSGCYSIFSSWDLIPDIYTQLTCHSFSCPGITSVVRKVFCIQLYCENSPWFPSVYWIGVFFREAKCDYKRFFLV